MYGSARFEQITIPKKIAISCGTPLILLPQTYGPFKSIKARNTARAIIKASTAAFARDSDSFARLRDLVGADFNPAIHKQGIDLAFGLPWEQPSEPPRKQHVGINVSGLLWNNNCSRSQFALKADYQQTLLSFCQHILENENLDILLVPHVTPANKYECDLFASEMLKKQLPWRYRHRVHIETTAKTPSHLKSVIANTCWFTGARMHATIAALSTGVPVVNVAYSAKAKGVFSGCGVGDCVLDMRHLTTANMVTGLIRCFNERSHHKAVLCRKLPFLKQQWAAQLNAINQAILTSPKKQGCCYA
ncbi:MAG: polysaccharide pyruvyl transferase family protein [Kordiimonadaceae bacterium]|nr:polysaccharide pyruvyl transferase family protein [Kordiimonadaceae bacterium]